MFNNCRGVWSVYRPDAIVLGVMSLLDSEELLINGKESLPVLTCGLSQKFSASLELHEFVFFSEKWKFLELVRIQPKLCFCHSPHRSVTYSHVTSDLPHGSPLISLNSRFMAFRFLEVFTICFRLLPGRRPSLASSLKRQIASDTVCRGTLSKRTISHCRFPRLNNSKIADLLLDIVKTPKNNT
ncbi:hypothetical protein AVEN_90022-1 [Araneus ventricosus]|uniref:Uncharacterized protein n=1 Tax=Araneus ventricosus TaxID=182803 RepID=A0A4Y2DAL9_ARAVE|nr:hypothetical protein AVEN_90022-1 [Araneus ventricosus]